MSHEDFKVKERRAHLKKTYHARVAFLDALKHVLEVAMPVKITAYAPLSETETSGQVEIVLNHDVAHPVNLRFELDSSKGFYWQPTKDRLLLGNWGHRQQFPALKTGGFNTQKVVAAVLKQWNYSCARSGAAAEREAKREANRQIIARILNRCGLTDDSNLGLDLDDSNELCFTMSRLTEEQAFAFMQLAIRLALTSPKMDAPV